MAATGILAAAYSSVTTALADAGLVVVTDPRNARPLSVFVELPTGEAFNENIVDVTIRLRVLAAPPGNQDAADYLLTTFDTIHQLKTIAVVDFTPSTTQVGEQVVPSYDITVRLSTRRN
jgi:hypothetical protein